MPTISPFSQGVLRTTLFLGISRFGRQVSTKRKEPMAEFKSTAVLPYVHGVSEPLRRFLEQQGIHTLFKSETTLRSHVVRPKDTIDPAKQDGVVYRIPCECGKVYIGETGRSMHERIKSTTGIHDLPVPISPPFLSTSTRLGIIRFGTR